MSDLDMDLSVELCMFVASSTPESFEKREIVRLLATGADINFQDANRNFNTPLHLAIERRNLELIRLLLHFEPSFKIKNMHGERPRDFAVKLTHMDVVTVLDEYRSKKRPSSHHAADKESFDSGVSFEIGPEIIIKSTAAYTSSRVQYLLSITKIDPHFKRTSFDMELVRGIYAKMDENILLRPLLKIAKEIRRLEIYFLYDQSNNELSSCSISELSGNIFVYGPYNSSALTANLAHKLTHYALNHVNDNECKPYRRKQSEKMFRFKKIVTVYKRKPEDLDPTVQHVFRMFETLWDAELIACVPYFLAFHSDDPEKLREVNDSHRELFDFFYEVVLKDIDDHLVHSNYRKFKGRPVEGSSFGKATSHYDPYKNETLAEKYGSNVRHNKRNNRALERICAIL